MELFNEPKKESKAPLGPLADRMRPQSIDDMVGQQHLIGQDGPLQRFFQSEEFPSIIFWGPPGVGKTTFAMLFAYKSNYSYERLSAIDAGVKEVRDVIAKAKMQQSRGKKTLLFIDEIHRFNKNQQDALLHAVESGTITLIGATTENPSFEVNSALLSRCQVYRLYLLSDEDIKTVVNKALMEDVILKKYNIKIEDWEFLIDI